MREAAACLAWCCGAVAARARGRARTHAPFGRMQASVALLHAACMPQEAVAVLGLHRGSWCATAALLLLSGLTRCCSPARRGQGVPHAWHWWWLRPAARANGAMLQRGTRALGLSGLSVGVVRTCAAYSCLAFERTHARLPHVRRARDGVRPASRLGARACSAATRRTAPPPGCTDLCRAHSSAFLAHSRWGGGRRASGCF